MLASSKRRGRQRGPRRSNIDRAHIGLLCTVVAAPVLIGSVSPWAYLLAVIVTAVSLIFAALGALSGEARGYAPTRPLWGLIGLSALMLAQSLPAPRALVELISPVRAALDGRYAPPPEPLDPAADAVLAAELARRPSMAVSYAPDSTRLHAMASRPPIRPHCWRRRSSWPWSACLRPTSPPDGRRVWIR